MISTIRLKRQDTCGLLRARITQVVGECIVEFTGVDVCRIEVAELYVEESITMTTTVRELITICNQV